MVLELTAKEIGEAIELWFEDCYHGQLGRVAAVQVLQTPSGVVARVRIVDEVDDNG
jgi:hypothetical protein